MSFKEIYKCLRDGLSDRADNDYKNICFRILLSHIYWFSRDNPEAMSSSEAKNIECLYFVYHGMCSSCDEVFSNEDLNSRNDCGCKMICDDCLKKHDKECEDYKALTSPASKAPQGKGSSSSD